MKLIGIEEYFLTAKVQNAWYEIGLELVDPSVGYDAGAMERRLIDLAGQRLALMDVTALDVQALSLTTPALHDLGPVSVESAQRTNDALAATLARHPTRFQAMATLPVSIPDEAALELDRRVGTLGVKGTMLCGRVDTRKLDDPAFAPVLGCAATLGVPVLLHPGTPDMAVRSTYYSGFSPTMDAVFATIGARLAL
jgi:predicted TIM-barrel fold metal-dependent hydrolase